MNDKQTSAAVYDDTVVRQFSLMAVVWGVVGMLVGVIIASQLAWPELNFGIPWLSYGRLRPLHRLLLHRPLLRRRPCHPPPCLQRRPRRLHRPLKATSAKRGPRAGANVASAVKAAAARAPSYTEAHTSEATAGAPTSAAATPPRPDTETRASAVDASAPTVSAARCRRACGSR